MDASPNVTPPPPPPPVQPKRRRRWLRAGFVVLVALLSLVVAAPHVIAIDSVRQQIATGIGKELGVPCRIDRLGFSWFTGIAAEGIEIGNLAGFPTDHPLLRLRRFEGDLSLGQLVRGRFEVVGAVVGLQLFVDQHEDGTTNVSALGQRISRGASTSTSGTGSGRNGGRATVARSPDLDDIRLELQVRESSVEIRRDTQLLETLTDLSCAVTKPFGSQRVAIDLDTRLRPLTPNGQPGRLTGKFDANLVTTDIDALLTAAGLDLQRWQPLVDTFAPGGLTALGGLVNGTLTARLAGQRRLTIDGNLTVVGPELAGDLVRGMHVRSERWTLTPNLTAELGAAGKPPTLDATKCSIDLGFLQVRGLTNAATERLLAGAPGLGLAYTLDTDQLAAFGGPMPEWLHGTQGRVTGEVGVPFGAEGIDLATLADRAVTTGDLRAPRLAFAGAQLENLQGHGELRDGQFTFTTTESTLLNQGGLTIDLRSNLRERNRLPTSLRVRWNGGRLQGGATTLLRYVVPMLAGLDAEGAQFTGLCDVAFELTGPALPTGEQNWLQMLNEWAGSGTLGLRQGTLSPAGALHGLLAPLGALPGLNNTLGDAGKLAIDSFSAPWTLRAGTLEVKAARWLAKGKAIGLSGTARLDGTLNYGFDFTALLQGHRDGDRVLNAIGGKLPAAKLIGTFAAPSLGLPDLTQVARNAVEQQVQTEGKELLRKALDELLKKKR